MNIAYLIYQAERPRSTTEQRQADTRAGEMAAAFARLGRSLRRPVTGKQDARWQGRPPAIETISCTVPRPR
jgi:hypothetical protein